MKGNQSWGRRRRSPLVTGVRNISLKEWLAFVALSLGVFIIGMQFGGDAGRAAAPMLQSAATSDQTFACPSPSHYDGDAIRCGFAGRSMRLYGIDAPEMPGACRPGRQCTPGDPFAARDHLAALTRGASVRCRQVDADRYGRRVVQCSAGTIDLSCQMVRDGYAVERYGRLSC